MRSIAYKVPSNNSEAEDIVVEFQQSKASRLVKTAMQMALNTAIVLGRNAHINYVARTHTFNSSSRRRGVCFGGSYTLSKCESEGFVFATVREKYFLENADGIAMYKAYTDALWETPECKYACLNKSAESIRKLGFHASPDANTFIVHSVLIALRRAEEHSYSVPITLYLMSKGHSFWTALALSEPFFGDWNEVGFHGTKSINHGDLFDRYNLKLQQLPMLEHLGLLLLINGKGKAMKDEGNFYGVSENTNYCVRSTLNKFSYQTVLKILEDGVEESKPSWEKVLKGTPWEGINVFETLLPALEKASKAQTSLTKVPSSIKKVYSEGITRPEHVAALKDISKGLKRSECAGFEYINAFDLKGTKSKEPVSTEAVAIFIQNEIGKHLL